MSIAGPGPAPVRADDRRDAIDAIHVVHVIDDDEVFRNRLVAFLRGAGLEVIGYASAAHFLDQLNSAETGCLITDVRMPEMTGLELLDRLGDQRGRLPAIVLTGAANVRMAVDALKMGAVEFIEKPFDPDVLLKAIRRALSQLDDDLRRVRHLEADARRIAGLSGRERDVLDGILEGRSNKEIARSLGISPRTVEGYRSKLMTKMDAESISELVQRAISATRAPDI